MPDYLAPGVYVSEVAAGARPIEGVSTSTAELVGEDVVDALRRVMAKVERSTITRAALLSKTGAGRRPCMSRSGLEVVVTDAAKAL